MRSSRAYGTTGRRSHCRAWRALLMCRFAGLHNASTGAHLRVQRARAQERCASQCVGRTALTSTKLSSRHLRAATGDAYDEVWLQRPQPLERAPSETPFSQQLKFDYKIGVGSLTRCHCFVIDLPTGIQGLPTPCLYSVPVRSLPNYSVRAVPTL